MCSLVIAWQVFAEAPVVVAANRDERLDRPAQPPDRRPGPPAIVAPRDTQAGGTWIGYNERGVFIGLSNRWVDTELDGERSRGQLVIDLLHAESTDDVASRIETALEQHRYQPFNLVAADAETALVFEWDGTLRVSELDPGVHAVLNAGWDDRFVPVDGREQVVADQVERARHLREDLAVRPDETADEWLDRAGDVLADHELGVCVHEDGYGTRSSSLIALHADGTAEYRFAEGPPCQTTFAPVEEQI